MAGIWGRDLGEGWAAGKSPYKGKDVILKFIGVIRWLGIGKSEDKGIVPTEMELILEQTQQGIIHGSLGYLRGMLDTRGRSDVERLKYEVGCGEEKGEGFKQVGFVGDFGREKQLGAVIEIKPRV
ncbi:hypothetical protein Tco_0640622 [Tanacetum coccineum]